MKQRNHGFARILMNGLSYLFILPCALSNAEKCEIVQTNMPMIHAHKHGMRAAEAVAKTTVGAAYDRRFFYAFNILERKMHSIVLLQLRREKTVRL